MSLKEQLIKVEGCEFFENHDLTSFTTMRITSMGDLIIVKSIEALKKILPILNFLKKDYLLIGWGANQVLPPRLNKIVMKLDFEFEKSYLDVPQEKYHLPASLGLNHLTAHAAKFGLKGWEIFTGIPASLGGAIFMNAGTNLGEISSLIESVEIINRAGESRIEKISAQSFSYRKNHFCKPGDIIVGATLLHHGQDLQVSEKIKSYLSYRKSSQPLMTKNCGCVFKNPQQNLSAGRLIDLIGLKGFQVGGLRISPLHGNFIENVSGGTWQDFQTLINLIERCMDDFYGLKFELEVKIPYD